MGLFDSRSVSVRWNRLRRYGFAASVRRSLRRSVRTKRLGLRDHNNDPVDLYEYINDLLDNFNDYDIYDSTHNNDNCCGGVGCSCNPVSDDPWVQR